MREFKHKVTISSGLADLLDFIEVYDSASSVGVAAFAISDALILRYMLDHVDDRNAWYVNTKNELNSIIEIIKRFETVSQSEDIPFIYPEYRERRDHFAYFACSEKLAGFDTQREAFLGPYRGWDSPLASGKRPYIRFDRLWLATGWRASYQVSNESG